MRLTSLFWIAFTHFHPKLMKYISSSIETCFFMILRKNIILWIHFQNFSFWSKFHCSHMKLVVQSVCQVCEFLHFLNFDSHEKRQTSSKLLKIHIQSSGKFSTLLICILSSCDSSPSLITSRWRIFES